MSGPRLVRVLAAHIPALPPGVALSDADEEAMRKRLAESVHLSVCIQRGEPTPEGYVWWVLDHPPGEDDRCGGVLDILASYGNWRGRPVRRAPATPPCSRDKRCCRSDRHDGPHLYPDP